MKHCFKTMMMASLGSVMSAGVALADTCDVSASGTYGFISNSTPLFVDFGKELKSNCDVDVQWKALVENRPATLEGLLAPQSPFAGIVLSNSQFGNYNSQGLLRPLDDILKKHRSKYPFLKDNMLIKVDGKVYAIAFKSNLQHLIYRQDLFQKYGIEEPQNFDDVVTAAKKLKGKSDVDYAFGAAFKSGWNLATEFTNLYLSTGDEFFKKGFKPNLYRNKNASRALKTLKKLYGYASPNSLGLASGDITALFQSGQIGIMQIWATRAAATEDPKLSQVIGKVKIVSAVKLSQNDPYTASALWWDGFAIPKTTTHDPEITFQLFMELLDQETVSQSTDQAVWISPYYKANKYSQGVTQTIANQVRVWPSEPQFNILHNALGKYLPDYLHGSRTLTQTMKKVESEYKKVAKEKGYL